MLRFRFCQMGRLILDHFDYHRRSTLIRMICGIFVELCTPPVYGGEFWLRAVFYS